MKLRDLLVKIGGTIDPASSAECEITGIASLHDALPGDLSFLANAKYTKQVETTRASAVLVHKDFAGNAPDTAVLIRVDSPDKAFAAAVPLFTLPPIVRKPGVHPTAVIGENVTLGKDVYIGPYAVIGDGAVIGDRTVIEAHVVVAEECVLAEDVHLYPMVSIRERCRLGKRVTIHNGSVIGADGYGYATSITAEGIKIDKIPQLGIVEIEDDVEIGANTTIDRARFGATKIGCNTKIDNLVQIGHNVRTGPCCGIVSQVGIAVSTYLGTGVMLWGKVGVAGHLTIADGVEVLANAGVPGDLRVPGQYIGSPAVPKREALRLFHMPRTVENLQKEVAELRAQLQALQSNQKSSES